MANEHYTQEEWRVIWDSPSFMVSSFGRVMRIAARRPSHIGNIIKPWLSKDGYWMVSLYEEDRPKKFQVHRLVCKAFNGHPPSADHQAAHGNGIRTDNRPDNLRWATGKENYADRAMHGTHPNGVRNPRSKLTEADVLEIRRHRRTYGAVTRLSGKFGVTKQTIVSIMAGKIWAHIPWEQGTAPQAAVS